MEEGKNGCGGTHESHRLVTCMTCYFIIIVGSDWLPSGPVDREPHRGQGLCSRTLCIPEPGTGPGMCQALQLQLSDRSLSLMAALSGRKFYLLFHHAVVFHQHVGMTKERDPGTSWICSLEIAWISSAHSLSHMPELTVFVLQAAEKVAVKITGL